MPTPRTMWGRRLLALFVFAWLSLPLLAAEVQRSVATGSRFTLAAAEAALPVFSGKPLVFAGGGPLGEDFQRVKVLTAGYPAAEVECELRAALPSGTYRLYLSEAAGGQKILLPGWFYVMAPVIQSRTPSWGTPGQAITLRGLYFGVNKPSVQLEYFDGAKKRLVLLDCPVKSRERYMDPESGESELSFKIPRKMPDAATVVCLRSSSGVGKTALGGFPFQKQDDLSVPMRDSVLLRGNLYTPAGDGPYPTLLFRTPYSKDEGDPYNERTFLNAVRRGYAVFVQDVRGRYDSEGDYTPYLNEARDGYDTIEWAAAQPWSDGRVGTFGLSYPGAVQWLALTENPPHLKAAVPAMCFSTLNQGIYFGGIFEIYWTGWAYKDMSPDVRVRQGLPGPQDCLSASREFAILGGDAAFNSYLPTYDLPYMKDTCQFYYDWLANPPYSQFYQFGEIRAKYGSVKAAVLNLSGWYDEAYGSEGATTNFLGLVESRAGVADNKTKLIIGPWTHGVESTQTPYSGDRRFPDDARLDYDGVVLDWLDFYVRDIANDVPRWPAVQVYQMEADGGGRWLAGASWPLTGTTPTPVYLIPAQGGSATGLLSWTQPDVSYPPSTFTADPLQPVTDPFYTNFGAYDLSFLSSRSDTLTFDSEPLANDLRVVGQVQPEIYLSSDAPDCDLFVMLLDVSPDGKALNLTGPGQEGMRVSYRKETSTRDLLEPGQVVRLDFQNVRTGNVFKKGHRLRVCICASWFPIYSRNLQTGELETTTSAARTAAIRIHQEIGSRSRIVLPVVPDSPGQ